jgi:PAS domain S-box-containing protein
MNLRSKASSIFKTISLVSSYLLVIIGTTVMIGWVIKNQAITQIHTVFAPTHFNTALSIFLMGLSIILIVHKKHKLSIIPLLLIFVIATSTIIEHLFNLKFGIDELFIEDYIFIKTSSLGRMGLNTAICLTLGSFGLLATSLKLFKKYLNYVLFPISSVIGLIAIISLVGYLIGLESAYGWGHWTRMSINTSISFIILSIGLYSWFWHNYEKKSILNSTIQWRLILRIIIPVVLIYIVDSIADINHLKKVTEQKTDAELARLSYQFAEKIDNNLFNATEVLREARRELLISDSINEDKIYKVLEEIVNSDSLIYGSALLFNEYEYDKNKRLFGPYVHKPDSQLLRLDLADEIDYMHADVEWFNKAEDAGKSIWTEPYFDEGITNILLCTYSVPIYHEKELWAVITLDLNLKELPILMEINESNELQYYIVSTEGTFLYNSTRPNLVGKNHYENNIQYNYDIADSLPSLFSTDVSGKFEYIGSQSKNENWLYYIPINSAPWKVYLGISEYNAIEEVRAEILNQLLILLFVIIVLTIVIVLISRTIAQPIKSLNTAVKNVAEGDYNTIIETKSKNEIGHLAKSFNLMNTKLISREKELIEKEQRYRALIESSNTGAWEFNSETNFLWCSREYFTMLGRNEADYDLSGNDNLKNVWLDLLHPDDSEKAANQFSNYLEGGSVGMYESIFRMKHKEGNWVWIWSRARTLRSEDNSLTSKTIGTHIDISKQKETEESQKQLIHEVGERMKELNCLYEVYKILDSEDNTITDILNKIVKIIPPSWQYPDITCAKINFLNQDYLSDNFTTSAWSQKEDILINGEVFGAIEVYYTEEKPASDIGPFMKEEQHLIEAIAIQIANFHIKKTAEVELLKSKELLEVKVEERTTELQESQSQFTSMVSNVPGVIYRCLLDEAWTMLFISDEIQNLTGYAANDFLNNSKRTFADIMHSDDIKWTSKHINETLKKGETFHIDYRILTSKGKIKWVRGQGQAVYSKDSNIQYLDGVIFDITEQKTAEIEIANAEEKVRLILESAGEGILGVDNIGITTFVNSAALRMLGYSQDEILGKTIHDVIHSKLPDGSNYPLEDCPMYKTYTQGLTKHVDTEVLWRKDGSSFPVDYISKPITKDGNCVGAVITFSDITERKEAEEKLLLSRYALDHAGDSILWIDVNNGKLKYVNKKSWTTLEYSQEELLDLHVFDIDPNLTKDSWKQLSGKIIKEGIVNFESINKRKGGGLFPIEVTASYIKFGEVEHIIAFTRDISERKKSEEELQKINMLSDNALELTMSGFWDIDFTKDNLYHQSDRATAIFGMIPSEDKIYKISDWFDAVVAGDSEIAKDVDDKFNGAIVGKYPTYDVSFPFKRPVDGKIVWIHALGIMERDENGKALYMYGVTQDITKSKLAEEKSQKLLTAVEKSPVMVSIATPKGIVDYVNPEYSHVTGFSSKEVIGKTHSLLKTGILTKSKYDEIFKYLQNRKNWSGELESRKKNGSAFWSSLSLAGVHDKAGDLTHIVIIEEDITERKLAEEKSQKLLTAVEKSPVMVSIATPKGIVDYVNPEYSTVTGFNSKEVIGKTHSLLKTGILSKSKYDEIFKYLQNQKNWSGELESKKKDGSAFWSSLSLAGVHDNTGDLTHIVIIEEDITERKGFEFKLAKAKELAEGATKAKSEFLATMSHEIRTPMNAIIGLSQLALATDLDTKQVDYVKKINSSGHSLLGIINDILDFSKIEAGKLSFENIDFDLEQVFQDHANVVTYKAHEKGLEFVLGIGKDVPLSLVGDPLRLRQVLVNLVNNAIKFTHKGEISVLANLVKETEETVVLEFSVNDTGIGIEEQKLNKLFKSFSQADASTTRKYGGTGLGLAICKGIVDGQDGKIWVKSTEGKGSSFCFSLTFTKQKSQKKDQIKPTPDVRGLKVLLCDDNSTALEILENTLEDLSFKVTAVNSGAEAIGMIEQNIENPFDLLLLDWKMPEMNGIETIKALKTKFGTKILPSIIMVTAYNSDEIYQDVKDMDISGLLVKPVNHSTLLNAIMTAFGKMDNIKTFNKNELNYKVEKIAHLKGARILLVEDNDINQQVAKELIETAGINVDVAENGQVAVNILKTEAHKYQLVFMDIQMPVMDGYTATRLIRIDLGLLNIPIVAMTADAITGVKEKCLKIGMDDFITKPLDTDNLYETLKKHIPAGSFEAEILTKPVGELKEVDIPEFKHINTTEGLNRVNNNSELYADLLNKFHGRYSNFEQDLTEVLSKPDELKRYIHTLKGTSGNIGAMNLHKATIELELNILNPDFENILKGYQETLDLVLNELSPFIQKRESLNNLSTQDNLQVEKSIEDIADQLSELKTLINNNDLEAADKLKEILHENLKPEIKTKLTKVLEALDSFDFDTANELLNELNI